jgi:hypothetical protein
MTYAQRLASTAKPSKSFIMNRKSTASVSPGKYYPSPTDFINSFYAVLRRWRIETSIYSDPDKITSHPSFSAMVQNAELVTPLIIEELRIRPSLLVWVLDDAFHSDKPYPKSDVGNIKEMTNAWIAWAEHHGRVL